MTWEIGDKVKVKEQDIIGEVVPVHDDTEVIICEIDGEFECPDGHLSYRPYELEIA